MAGSDRSLDTFWLCYGEYRGRLEIKPFLCYYKARCKRDFEEYAYRRYTAEALMATANNLAETFGGISMNKSYADIIEYKPKEEKTAKQIIDTMKSKFNGEEIYELV